MRDDLRGALDDASVTRSSAEIPLDEGEFDDDGPEPYCAVGAVVTDPDGRVALVENDWSDGWVLPGGTVEPGERLREAAVREVREETGLDADVGDPLHVEEQTFVFGERSTTEYFVVFEAAAAGPVGEDLGEDDVEIEAAAWHDAVPDRMRTDLVDGDLVERAFADD